MTFDPSGDWQVFDGTETITYTQGQTSVTVQGVLREQLSTAEASLGAEIGLQPTDVPFNLPGPNLAPIVPDAKQGDRFTDSTGQLWTVETVAYDILTRQYRVMARRGRS